MRHDFRTRHVRVAPLGRIDDQIAAAQDLRQVIVGQVLRPTLPVRCQRLRLQGLALLCDSSSGVPVRTTFPAHLVLHEDGQETSKSWTTHLMVLADGRVFAAANPLVPDDVPFDAFTIAHTDDPPAPPPSGLAEGALIATPDGPRPVSALKRGDLVLTRDAGAQPLVAADRVVPQSRPSWIEFDRNIIGQDVPTRKVLLTSGTLILAQNSVVSRMFESDAVLVFAERLVDLHGVRLERYHKGPLFQLRLARPQVIFADGVPVGSTLNPGDAAGRHAQEVPPLARQKALVLRMWRNGVRTCVGDAPARSRTDRIRHLNAMRRQEAAARVIPHASMAPADYKVDQIGR